MSCFTNDINDGLYECATRNFMVNKSDKMGHNDILKHPIKFFVAEGLYFDRVTTNKLLTIT